MQMNRMIPFLSPQNTFISVRARVVLGNPALQCARYGVCEVDILPPPTWDAFVPATLRIVKAELRYSPENGLQLSFPLNGMLPATYEAFFSQGHFLVETALLLPKEVCLKLGAADALCIEAGVYPLEYGEKTVEMTLSACAEPAFVGQR
jgi:hypothetical protein